MRDDRRIRGVISRIVPAGALAHVTFCRVEGTHLRVTMDSAAWIPKLRFCERTLLTALALDGLELRAVSWHVAPAKAPSGRRTATRAARTASAQAARTMRSAAAEVGGDSPRGDELARQMRRLADRLVGKGDDPASD